MKTYLNGAILAVVDDITKISVDAVVNAANSNLQGGAGVDGAIHRAGGHKILEECREIIRKQFPNGLPTGVAVATTGGNLPAKHVIHTVGPVWYGGNANEEALLADCYLNSLNKARELGCKTMAFPAISTGVYGFPAVQAAKIASRTIREFLGSTDAVEKIYLVFFTQSDYNVFIGSQEFGG